MEDEEYDMFQGIKPSAVPAEPSAPVKKAASVPMSDSEDDSSEEEKFIVNETIAANRKNKKSGGFQSMGLSNSIFKAILHKGFKVPTPIQRKTIPLIMQGQDVVGMARTGSGKTAAFLIPMLERLKSHSAKVGARALVLSPSRELALQTQKVCKELGKYTDLRSCVLVGGDNLDDQFSMIASNPDILIATPGRLLHLVVEMDLDLRSMEYVVFDEADRLFEMGFTVQLHEILARLPTDRQTLLFSATLPKMLVDFAKAGLQEPTLVRLDADTKISKDLEMAFFSVKESEKEAALLYLLRNVIKLPKKTAQAGNSSEEDKKKKKKRTAVEAEGQTILFVATKHHVEYLSHILKQVGYQVSYVYGSLDQTARNIQVNRFRSGLTNLLVVTDVAARGIDIPILENVINYDFPGTSKVFVHRVGRVARAGRRGWAYSLVTASEFPYMVDLSLFLTRPVILGYKEKEKENVDYTSSLVIGSMPSESLSDDILWIQQQIAGDASLEGMHKTAGNAYKLYNKTKPRAAAESYGRAKELMKKPTWKDLHPLFLTSSTTSELEQQRLELINKISDFRPAETIFEVGRRGQKKADAATMVMRSRREAVGAVIEAAKSKEQQSATVEEGKNLEKRITDLGGEVAEDDLAKVFNIPKSSEKVKPTSHRDEEYYLHYTQKDANTERGYSMKTSGSFAEQAERVQLDLVGDDNDALNQIRRNALRWDSKKKKFVRGTGIGSDNKKLIKTESGALIPATYKSGRFDEWSKKKKIAIPRTGEKELPSAANMQVTRRYRHNAKEPSKDENNKKRKRAESELKTPAQVRKERLLKQKRKEKNARPSRKKHKSKH